MKKDYIKKLRRVEITWNDSFSRTSTWYDLDLVSKISPNDYITSIGYLVKKDKKIAIIAQSLHFEDSFPTKGGHIFEIPMGCIKKIKFL